MKLNEELKKKKTKKSKGKQELGWKGLMIRYCSSSVKLEECCFVGLVNPIFGYLSRPSKYSHLG